MASSVAGINGVNNINTGTGGSGSAVGGDFRKALGDVFNYSEDVLRDYADPTVTQIELPGIGIFSEKSSPATLMGLSLALEQNRTQVESITNYLTYIYRSLPQQLYQMVS